MRRLALVLMILAAMGLPASVARADTERRGDCVGGPATWRLDVQREDGAHLRVRFEVRGVDEGERWQIFVSNDGVRELAKTRTARGSGSVRVRLLVRDRVGRDRIAASAVSLDDGETCSGRVRS